MVIDTLKLKAHIDIILLDILSDIVELGIVEDYPAEEKLNSLKIEYSAYDTIKKLVLTYEEKEKPLEQSNGKNNKKRETGLEPVTT